MRLFCKKCFCIEKATCKLERSNMQQCFTCGFPMLRKKWKVDFVVDKQRFITVLNYPLYICSYCGNQLPKLNANEQILKKINEKENRQLKPSALKFEESF